MVSPESRWVTPFKNPFWAEAANRYMKLRRIPSGRETSNWKIFASYAGTHRMSTDAVYLARVTDKMLAECQANTDVLLRIGAVDTETLCIIEDNLLSDIPSRVDLNVHFLAAIDGFNVLVPGLAVSTSAKTRPLELRDQRSPLNQ